MSHTFTRVAEIHMNDPNNDSIKQKLNYINQNATLNQMDTGFKKLVRLTNNSYIDSKITESYSLNEAISEEEEE